MLTVIVLSLLVGILLTLAVQFILIRRWFFSLPVVEPAKKEQNTKFSLPEELVEALRDPDLKNKRESVLSMNLIFQFLFKELRDTQHVRRWVMKRMNNEFAEMLQTTTGKLLDQITVRDFNLGNTFPIIKTITVENVVTKDNESQGMEELSLLLDLVYNGGFQLAVDVDLVFGKAVYLSVQVTKLHGVARLHFCRKPYTHWSFSFTEDPTMDFQVESHYEGRPISQVTSLIINQIRRSVRKKHTLPNYKIRYRPFFIKPEPKTAPQDIFVNGCKLSTGRLEVNILECTRLVKVSHDSYIYCTLAIDSLPWTDLMSSRRKLWVALDLEIVKGQAQNIGLNFKEEFIHEKYEEMVVVDSVIPKSPAALADIRKNDIVISVGNTKITSSKQAAKLMKQAGDRFFVHVERPTPLRGLGQAHEFRFEEDTVSLRNDNEAGDNQPSMGDNEEFNDEDFVNIIITPIDAAQETKAAPVQTLSTSAPSLPAAGPLKEKSSSTGPDEKILSSSPSRKGFSILSSSSGLFQRKRGRIENRSPSDSPEVRPKVDHGSRHSVSSIGSGREDEGKPASVPATPITKKRSKPDVSSLIKERQAALERLQSTGMSDSSNQGNDSDDDGIDLKKSRFVRATQEPWFDEKFEFEVEDSHNYLNICVWCKIPEKLDKQNRVVKPEKDVLLGHVSVSLMDIALECLATLQGETQQTYQLTPSEIKATASRTKISSHPGFEERLCYGDITLILVHGSHQISKPERKRIEKTRMENEAQQKCGRDGTSVSQIRRHVEEGKHEFMGTHFQSSTYCNFCLKKIWLKVAFQCRICGMICHKKCTDKCQAQTKCSKEDFQAKFRIQPQQTSPTTQRKSFDKEREKAKEGEKEKVKENEKEKDNNGKLAQQKAGFLSKFRKDSPKLAHKELKGGSTGPIMLTPGGVHYERRRSNSAPSDEMEQEVKNAAVAAAAAAAGLIAVNNLHRTRSSTSIDLMQENRSSSQVDRSAEPSSESEDEEENLLKFFEHQRSTQTALNAEEVVVTAAKEMGRELYANLSQEERRNKLDNMVNKLQKEIDSEAENRSEMASLEKIATDDEQRNQIRASIEKSDEKIQSLALLMLHYCTGLQHCMDQIEEDATELAEREMEAETASIQGMEVEETSNKEPATLRKVQSASAVFGIPILRISEHLDDNEEGSETDKTESVKLSQENGSDSNNSTSQDCKHSS